MEVITRAARMHSVALKFAAEEKPIGFVPTMGALHEGHLSLVREARRMADAVIVSIFVNPTQFRPGDDFDRYPRDLARDADLLTPIDVDYIFAPSAEEIYPKGFSTWVTVEGLSDKLEGAARPGHFRGVTTVLAILFNIIHPKFVFMGQKDAQQTVIAKKLVRDLHLPVEIVVLPTVREPDGLALSSRNQYLTPEERRAATVLYRALHQAEEMFADGEHHANRLIRAMQKEIAREHLARTDYIAITDTERLEPVEDLTGRTALVSLAVHIGSTRLIDNVILDDEKFRSKSGRLKLG
jgi:pantoate--beta-alanine ligase